VRSRRRPSSPTCRRTRAWSVRCARSAAAAIATPCDYLEARAAKKAADLDESRRPALEKWVAEKSVSDDQLKALAAARAERLEKLLEQDYGVGEKRLVLGEPTVARDGGHAEVVVGVAP